MKNEDAKPREKRRGAEGQSYWRWVIDIFALSIALSAVMSFCSGTLLSHTGYVLSALVLAFFILLGILFDVIGVAVTAASPRPFHSMASHRTPGAREALFLLKRAEKTASICNDVVGDICGIVSGSTAAVIVSLLKAGFGSESILFSIAVTALISGLTIGGKALGKRYAMKRSKEVVFAVAKVMHIFRIGRNDKR